MVVTRPKRIALGADHGGIDLKSVLAEHLQKAGHQVEDVGTSSHEAVDYPVFARAVAEAVSQERADVGIMIDGAGIGSCMVANKIPGVRALGAGLIGASLAQQIVETWLATECTEPRHRHRVAMFADSGAPLQPGATSGRDEVAEMHLSDQDIDRVVTRLHQIMGPMTNAEPTGPCVGDNPESNRPDERRPGGESGKHPRRPGALYRSHLAQTQRDRGTDSQALRRGSRIQLPVGVRKPDVGVSGS
jgi:ribose 5-phosphate isomerase B